MSKGRYNLFGAGKKNIFETHIEWIFKQEKILTGRLSFDAVSSFKMILFQN